MRKHSLRVRLLVPALLVLVVLPPVSCLIFREAAERYAYEDALNNLQRLQDEMVPLVEKTFPQNAEETMPPHAEKVRAFLQQTSAAVRQMAGSANLLILGTEAQLIYPRDSAERADVEPLAEDIAADIRAQSLPLDNEAVFWQDGTGESYLVQIYEVPTSSVRLKYMVVYCAISSIGSWVNQATLMVLVISFVFLLMAMLILAFTVRSVTTPLSRLGREAAKIGSGDFSEITTPFSVRELDQLRISMNDMSHRLEKSNQVQKDFFQNISHELRTPLMSISGYAQGIEQGVFPSNQEAAHTILTESVRLTALVNSLLTLSRMESGETVPKMHKVIVAEVVESCLDRYVGLAMRKNVELQWQPTDNDACIVGDEGLLEKILDNLLSNAIQYAKRQVVVSSNIDNDICRITVYDDGDGIAPMDLPHLFERCYKGEKGNFGLGLAIANSAVQIMHGTIHAENMPECGACLIVTLPSDIKTI